ncbi:MAG TPA: hypothetical protein VLV81_03670 [Acidimicrobiia bacterium]|nr:hypothetical protein [Acidimicrobiia bacterium]
MEDDDEVCLLVPPRSYHLRTVRLVAAEAGGRAGFDVSELDDLRIAVDELCYALMAASERRLLLRVTVEHGRVMVRGTGLLRPGTRPPALPTVSELIVDAVSDHYAFDHDGDRLSFVLVKQASRTVNA